MIGVNWVAVGKDLMVGDIAVGSEVGLDSGSDVAGDVDSGWVQAIVARTTRLSRQTARNPLIAKPHQSRGQPVTYWGILRLSERIVQLVNPMLAAWILHQPRSLNLVPEFAASASGSHFVEEPAVAE